jgi:hypothetical protein
VPGYTAIEIATGRRIRCASLAELEDKLAQARDGDLAATPPARGAPGR